MYTCRQHTAHKHTSDNRQQYKHTHTVCTTAEINLAPAPPPPSCPSPALQGTTGAELHINLCGSGTVTVQTRTYNISANINRPLRPPTVPPPLKGITGADLQIVSCGSGMVYTDEVRVPKDTYRIYNCKYNTSPPLHCLPHGQG